MTVTNQNKPISPSTSCFNFLDKPTLDISSKNCFLSTTSSSTEKNENVIIFENLWWSTNIQRIYPCYLPLVSSSSPVLRRGWVRGVSSLCRSSSAPGPSYPPQWCLQQVNSVINMLFHTQIYIFFEIQHQWTCLCHRLHSPQSCSTMCLIRIHQSTLNVFTWVLTLLNCFLLLIPLPLHVPPLPHVLLSLVAAAGRVLVLRRKSYRPWQQNILSFQSWVK